MDCCSRKVDLSRLPNDLVVDPTYGDPDLIGLRTAIHTRDWPAVTTILDSATDHNHLTYFVDFAADIRGLEQWLADVLARDLESTNALLLQGARHIVWAWEARGRRWRTRPVGTSSSCSTSGSGSPRTACSRSSAETRGTRRRGPK